MLFQDKDTKDEIWQAVKHELHRGALDAKHPFHWVNLGTVSNEFPSVRTVVLRKLTEELHFFVYTDYRSEKCSDLKQNSHATLHLYHPKKQVQIRVKVQTILHFQDEMSNKLWQTIPSHRRSEYTGSQAPGTKISSPDDGWKEGDSNIHFFTVLEFIPQELEVLQLSKNGHLRIVFNEENEWEGNWLTP